MVKLIIHNRTDILDMGLLELDAILSLILMFFINIFLTKLFDKDIILRLFYKKKQLNQSDI